MAEFGKVEVMLDAEQAIKKLQDVTKELEEVHNRMRGLTVGDALAMVGLLAFVIGWVLMWVFVTNISEDKTEELSNFAVVVWVFLVSMPCFWAASLINHIVRK